MTRRGTLAYYLAAWVIGCFIYSLLVWINEVRAGGEVGAAMLLLIYFLALAFGAAYTLFFAFMLRRVMRWWGTHSTWSWSLTGAVLGTALMYLTGFLYERIAITGAVDGSPRGFLVGMVVVGVDSIRYLGWWEVPVQGAATAAVLCLVDRAFNRPDEAGEAKQSPA